MDMENSPDQDNNLLLFIAEYWKDSRNEPWAAKSNLFWLSTGIQTWYGVLLVASTNRVAVDDKDELDEQLKIYFNMETYSTILQVCGRSVDPLNAPEQLEKTAEFVIVSYKTGVPCAKDFANFRKFSFSSMSSFLLTGTKIATGWFSQRTKQRHH